MSHLFRRAESILKVALAPDADSDGTAMVVDRAGHLRVLNLAGWTLSGLIQEFGAVEVYIVKKFAGTVTVDAWCATDRCTISQKSIRYGLPGLTPTCSATPYAARLQVTPQLAS